MPRISCASKIDDLLATDLSLSSYKIWKFIFKVHHICETSSLMHSLDTNMLHFKLLYEKFRQIFKYSQVHSTYWKPCSQLLLILGLGGNLRSQVYSPLSLKLITGCLRLSAIFTELTILFRKHTPVGFATPFRTCRYRRPTVLYFFIQGT